MQDEAAQVVHAGDAGQHGEVGDEQLERLQAVAHAGQHGPQQALRHARQHAQGQHARAALRTEPEVREKPTGSSQGQTGSVSGTSDRKQSRGPDSWCSRYLGEGLGDGLGGRAVVRDDLEAAEDGRGEQHADEVLGRLGQWVVAQRGAGPQRLVAAQPPPAAAHRYHGARQLLQLQQAEDVQHQLLGEAVDGLQQGGHW